MKHYLGQFISYLQAKNARVYQGERHRLVLLIILMMTNSQMAVTIYLPSMPIMASQLQTSANYVALTVSAYVIGFGISQFIYGPLSDVYGRRPIVLAGFLIFMLASFATVCSSSITALLIARVIQGFGMGCGDTMGRAMMCDCLQGPQFVKAAAYIGMAAVLTPVIAPVIGAYLQYLLGWRANFGFLLLYSCVSFYLLLVYLPETNIETIYQNANFTGIINRYLFILKNPIFLAYFVPGVVAFFGEISFSMIAPFLIQTRLGWSPIAFGWFSMLTIAGLLIGALGASHFSDKTSNFKMVLIGSLVMLFASTVMLLGAYLNYFNIVVIILPMALFMLGTGITYPNTNLGALAPFTAMAGTAGALQGGLQMLGSGILGLAVADLQLQTQWPLALLLTLSSLVGLVIFISILKGYEAKLKIFHLFNLNKGI